ncbi:MAG: alpha/beta hydrolase [Bacteroidetes bacterium]|nr:MAG: alpha/beta hydrolase [Bacteroidota bacterium]
MDNEKISGFAPVNGIRMYYEIYLPTRLREARATAHAVSEEGRQAGGGEKIPLILLHGGGSTIESTFGNLLPLLRPYGKIIAVELQSHGRSGSRPGAQTFIQDADDVAALLDFLKIEKANILGFSNGGTTTLQIAIRHPELINKLIVISASYSRDGMITGFFDSMDHATIDNMPQPLKDAYLKVNPDKEGLMLMFTKDRDRMIHFSDIPESEIKAIKFPTLIMLGDHDVVTNEHAVKMAHDISNSQLSIFPGTHGSFIGEVCSVKPGSKIPKMSADLILEFLAE